VFLRRKDFYEFGFKRVRFQARAPIAVLCVSILALVSASSLHAVPAAPNESLVVGEVLEKNLIDASVLGIEPQQPLLYWKLRIITVKDVQGSENFLRAQEGKTIEVYSKELDTPVVPTQSIETRVTFRGDGRMGRYWMIGRPEVKTK